MRRTPPVSLLAAAFFISLLPASAGAVTIHRHVHRVVGEVGPPRIVHFVRVVTVAPTDSDQDGVADREDGCPSTAGPVGGCPPPPPEPTTSSPQAVVASAPASSTVAPAPTGGAGCVGMEAESGSAGYGAVSPTGYIGCYQIGPEHYAAGGSCAGLGTDPAGQDACAGRICATEGPGAWTNSAGQNPCGRLP